MEFILIFILLFTVLILFYFINSYKKIKNNLVYLKDELSTEKSRRQSQSTRYGQLSEQFIPLLQNYPGNPKDFRFLGSPVDGIGFEEDKLIIAEFKVADSRLTPKQRNIKKLIEEGYVEFKEIRIDEKSIEKLNKEKVHAFNLVT